MEKKMTRRSFLRMGMKTAVAATVLSACGKVMSFGQTMAGKPGTITVGEDGLLTGIEELKTYGSVDFMYQGKRSVALYNGGDVRAFENICTHKGGPTKLQGDRLTCQWHGAQFDPLTGTALKGPAPAGSKLPPIPLRVRDGNVYVGAVV